MLEKHCRACGAALIEKELKGEGVVPFCPVCGEFRFPMYNVAVSMIVIDRQSEKILLVQQYGKPSYILVAGYVNRTESLESAVAREIKEETGMTVAILRRLWTTTANSVPTRRSTPARGLGMRKRGSISVRTVLRRIF